MSADVVLLLEWLQFDFRDGNMSELSRSISSLRMLRQDLESAAQDYPELRHVAVYRGPFPEDIDTAAEASFMMQHCSYILVKPLAAGKEIIRLLHRWPTLGVTKNCQALSLTPDNDGPAEGMVSVFLNNGKERQLCLNRVDECSRAFLRCLFPNQEAPDKRYRHDWSAYMMHLIYLAASQWHIPLLRSRRHELGWDPSRLKLPDKTTGQMREYGVYEICGNLGIYPEEPPPSCVPGGWDWDYVFSMFSKLDLRIRYLELNPFRAAALIVERLEENRRAKSEQVGEENGKYVPNQAVQGLPRHSSDFRSVTWIDGNDYEFTPTQAACVAVLWRNWEKGTPVLSGIEILDQAGSSGDRLDNVFSKGRHPAWQTMIVKANKGSYRLAPPAS